LILNTFAAMLRTTFITKNSDYADDTTLMRK